MNGQPTWGIGLGAITNPSATLDEIFSYLNNAGDVYKSQVLSASLDSECIFRGTSIKQLVQYALRIFSIV